jgi:hypothetical protein
MDITMDSDMKSPDDARHGIALLPPSSPNVDSIDIKNELTCDVKNDAQTSTLLPKDADLEMVEFKNEAVTVESPGSRDRSPGKKAETEVVTGIATTTEPEYPTGIRLILITVSMMLVLYMVALDTSILCMSSFLPRRVIRKPVVDSN